MTDNTDKIIASSTRLRDIANIMQKSALSCGNRVTARQAQALILIAEANKAGRLITRGEIQEMFGNVSHGMVSKLLRGMMHKPMERKMLMEGTVEGIRSEDDLRLVYLYLTPRGQEIVNEITS